VYHFHQASCAGKSDVDRTPKVEAGPTRPDGAVWWPAIKVAGILMALFSTILSESTMISPWLKLASQCDLIVFRRK
jgi:hypothetical protein